jgi:radical SAM protein with 4Fe4S-binding SPASM domain
MRAQQLPFGMSQRLCLPQRVSLGMPQRLCEQLLMNERLQQFAESFVDSTRDYIFVRKEDNLLIMRPNRVHQLNPTATDMLHILYNQEQVDVQAMIDGIKRKYPVAEEIVIEDLDRLLQSLSLILEGKTWLAPAVRKTPFGSHKRLYPVLSEIALTYRCQNKCFFCYASAPERGRVVPEMDTQQVKLILDKIVREAHVPTVSFTGGEPTLRTDLPELIAYAKSIGLRTNLITNGLRSAKQRLVEKLAASGLDSAQVSLEAGDASTHDQVVGLAGAFELTFKGVKNLKAVGIHTHTNTTINSLNRNSLPGLIDLLADLGQEYLSMNMVIRTGDAVGVRDIRYDEIKDVVLPLKEKAEGLGMRFVWYSPVPVCLFNPAAHGMGSQGCAAADGLLSISPDGQVLPCSSFEDGIGSLLVEDFDTLWNRRVSRYWRNKEYMPPGCKHCESAELCCGACPLYWDEQGTFSEISPFLSQTSSWERAAWRLKRRFVGKVKGVGISEKP